MAKNVGVKRRREIPETTFVESQTQLEEVCAHGRSVGAFAFDTEFVMEDRYESQLCLIQFATDSRVAIIDPFLQLSLEPVWSLIHDDRIETIVHAGQEDLGLCVQHTGRGPRRIFDVQVAAGLAGYEYPLSLQKLVQSIVHVRLHKTKTLTDWRRRPLTAEQIRYAAEDVAYLPAVYGKLKDRLTAMKRLDWAREEFSRFESTSFYLRSEEESIQRLKGAGSLNSSQLAVVREVARWRDAVAQRWNRPARIVLKDHLLVEIAKHGLSTAEEIRHLRGLSLNERDAQALAQIVKGALSLPPEQWPQLQPRELELAGEAMLVALITAVLRGYCDEHHLAYGLAAGKRSITELIRHRLAPGSVDGAPIELLSGWRGREVGRMLDDVLAGRRTIQVEVRDGQGRVRVRPNDESV